MRRKQEVIQFTQPKSNYRQYGTFIRNGTVSRYVVLIKSLAIWLHTYRFSRNKPRYTGVSFWLNNTKRMLYTERERERQIVRKVRVQAPIDNLSGTEVNRKKSHWWNHSFRIVDIFHIKLYSLVWHWSKDSITKDWRENVPSAVSMEVPKDVYFPATKLRSHFHLPTNQQTSGQMFPKYGTENLSNSG